MAPQATCFECSFTDTPESDAWDTADHPSLGTLTRCPECGSTDIRNR